MSGSKSDYLEKKYLDLIFGATAYTAPVTLFVAVSTNAYSDSATGSSVVEPVGNAYARVSVTNNTTNWPAATGTSPATKSNGTTINFPTASGNWGTLLSFYIADAATLGNLLYGGDLTASVAVNTGQSISFTPSQLTFTED